MVITGELNLCIFFYIKFLSSKREAPDLLLLLTLALDAIAANVLRDAQVLKFKIEFLLYINMSFIIYNFIYVIFT